ncbi:MAG TPA: sulfate ABC transporter substrate-binding protein [Solirubrobacterales bacterium]
MRDNWFKGRARRFARPVSAAVAASALVVGVAACGGSNDESSASGDGSGGSIDLVAYSTPETAYTETLEPDFNAQNEDGEVEFANSFGASGDQSRAVEAGQPADFVHLPLEPDITRLVDAGIVSEDWSDADYGGGIQNSVVVFVTRPGNPEGIEDWEDLVTGDVDVVTANPFTSGGARWNIMAAYGQVLEKGGTEEEGLEYVKQMLENTPIQDASARDALNTFIGGEGDVLLSYENEAIGAIEAGEEVEYTIPDETILIETLGVIPTDAPNAEEAEAFRDYLISEEGQTGWAENGYRPVDEKVLAEFEEDFPEPPGLFTIEEFGGWETVATEFFDPENGSVADIERELGVATE